MDCCQRRQRAPSERRCVGTPPGSPCARATPHCAQVQRPGRDFPIAMVVTIILVRAATADYCARAPPTQPRVAAALRIL
eukprot:6194042-Pleurochrysis_carterae.AAC.2